MSRTCVRKVQLVHGWQHPFQAAAVKQALELQADAVDQHFGLRYQGSLSGCRCGAGRKEEMSS